MAALLIKHKAVTLEEKLNVIRKVEANPNVMCSTSRRTEHAGYTLNGITAKKDVLFTRMVAVSSNVKRSRVGKYYKVEEKIVGVVQANDCCRSTH
jgi:hypothetical protein